MELHHRATKAGYLTRLFQLRPLVPRQADLAPAPPPTPKEVRAAALDGIEPDEPEPTFAFASYAKRITTPNEQD